MAVTADSAGRSDPSRTYVTLQESAPTPGPELILYCWPGSISCYQMEHALRQWRAIQNIPWLVQPVIKRPTWRLLAKARLVAKQMGHEELISNALYQHLHVDKLSIDSDQQLLDFIESLELDVSRFTNIFYAAETNQLLQKLDAQAASFGVEGVPTLIINRQWRLDASMHNTSRSMLSTAASLMNLEAP